MVGALALLKYQILAHWRNAFAVGSRHDKFSFFFLLLVLIGAYRAVALLDQASKSITVGQTESWSVIAIVVFVLWLFPAVESDRLSAKLSSVSYLPIWKNHLALIALASISLVPTSVFAGLGSLAAVYPLMYSPRPGWSVLAYIFYVLTATFVLAMLARMMKIRVFRLGFLVLTMGAVAVYGAGLSLPEFPPHELLIHAVSGQQPSAAVLLPLFAAITFLTAFLTMRLTIDRIGNASGRVVPNWFSRIKLPLHLSELIKRDFFSAWKVLDSWLALFVSIVYAVIF